MQAINDLPKFRPSRWDEEGRSSYFFLKQFPGLKTELQRELDYPWIYQRRTNHAKRRRRDVGDGIGELRMVERIEELRPELDVSRFSQQFERCALDDALAEEKRALELDPLSLIVNHGIALMLYFAGQYDSAIEQLRETIELDPNFALGHWSLGRVYRQQGRYEEAMLELRKAIDLSGGSPLMVAALGRTYAVSGQRDEARRMLDEIEDRGLNMEDRRLKIGPLRSVIFDPRSSILDVDLRPREG